MQSLRRCTRALTSISRLNRLNYPTTRTIIRKSSTININKNAFLSHFHDRIRENGHENALIFNNQNISYTQLYQSSLQCALYLKEKHNIKEGDVIAVIAKNIPQAQNIMIACQYLNAVFFPINGNLPKATIDYYNDKVNTKLIVTDNPSLYPSSNNNPNVIYIDPFKTNTNNNSNLSCIGDDYMLNTNLSSMENEIKDMINATSYDHEHNALMMQTSGSTALPKIVIHSAASTNGWIDNGFNPSLKSTALLTSQSYHVSSYFQLMTSLINGGCIIYPTHIMLNENATQKDKCLEMLRLADLYDIQTVTLVVTPVYELVKLGLNFGNSVKSIVFGGDIIPAPLLQRFMRLHANNDTPPIMVNIYGSTEAGIIGMSMLQCTQDTVEDLERIRNELSYLNKMPNVHHRIDEETGELCVKTNSLMRGYYGDVEKTKEAFTDDGYYKTGDTVNVMEDCNDDEAKEDLLKFMVVSRNKQVIVGEGGRYIFPQYIENELLGHDMVSGAVVVGIDCKLLYGDDCCYDENVYKYPVAFVRTNKKLEKKQRNKLVDELMSLCENRNENEVPFKIFLVDDIPRVHIGKVDRNKLENFANEYFKIINENKEMMKKDKVFTLTVSQEMAGQFSV